MQAASLTATFADPEAMVTVLAPTDEAFGMIPEQDLMNLLNNPPALGVVRARIPTMNSTSICRILHVHSSSLCELSCSRTFSLRMLSVISYSSTEAETFL